MKYIAQILISTILLITIASCDSPDNTETQINNIDIVQQQILIKDEKNIVVLDVRTPEEHAVSHIERPL